MLTLDVAIATYRPEGIQRVAKMLAPLPPKEGIRFVVSWQEHEDTKIPEALLDRPDVKIVRYDRKGVSNNRNNALKYCDGDIILMGDDDLIYDASALTRVPELFEEKPEMDLAIFKIKFKTFKRYPEKETKISIPFPKGYYGTTMEMAVRRKKLGNLLFWPGIGPGNKDLATGEDELFLISAIKRNLNVIFINLQIAEHPNLTTGDKVSPGILKGQGFLIRLLYPLSFPLRLIVKSYRVSRQHQVNFLKSWADLTKGAIYAKRNWDNIPKEYRW